jgi:myo-inositol-1(or 4)-monophosphatase
MISPISTSELTVAEEAARAGGTVLARYFHEGVEMRSKDIANLVSDADLEAERAIVAVIRKTFLGHEVLGEEAHVGDVGAEHLWIVDPLDGTNNFAHRIPHSAVSVAFYRGGQAECGVVFNPARHEWHVAARGRGAYHDGRRVRVAEHTRLDEALIGVGFSYNRGALMEATLAAIGDLERRQIHGIRRFGTASLDLCMVRLGMFGVYFELELSPWDSPPGGSSSRRPAAGSPPAATSRSRWPRPASSPQTAGCMKPSSTSSATTYHLPLDASDDSPLPSDSA